MQFLKTPGKGQETVYTERQRIKLGSNERKYFKCKAKGLKNLSMELEEGGSNFMDIII